MATGPVLEMVVTPWWQEMVEGRRKWSVVACQVAEIRGNPVWQSKNCLRCLPSMRAKWIREASPNQGCSFLNAVEKGVVLIITT